MEKSLMKTNYLLIDFENVHPQAIVAPEAISLKVYLFVGKNQNRVPLELAMVMQSMGDHAEYVRMQGSGKNALDFHIAYWLGKLAEQDPNGHFYIISKDTGFDPLIAFLKANQISARRVPSIAEIPILNQNRPQSLEDRVAFVTEFLRKSGNARPRKRTTLHNALSSLYTKALEDSVIEQIIVTLEQKGIVSSSENKVVYHLDP